MLVILFGFWVNEINWTSEMKDWTETDYKHVGKSFAYFLRMHQTGDAAVDTWGRNYPQLNELFEIDGFKEFMEVIASHLLLVNKFGMVFRVSLGATLSSLDAATDICVIATYYQSDELVGQAHALLAMIMANLVLQLLFVLGQYQKKSLAVKLREVLMCNFLFP